MNGYAISLDQRGPPAWRPRSRRRPDPPGARGKLPARLRAPLKECPMEQRRSSSRLARSLAAVKKWLRHTWISRLPVPDWCQGWHGGLRGPRPRRRALLLACEILENRFPPNDLFGLLQAPLVPVGVELAAGLQTPAGVLARGWSAGLLAAGRPLPAPSAGP